MKEESCIDVSTLNASKAIGTIFCDRHGDTTPKMSGSGCRFHNERPKSKGWCTNSKVRAQWLT